jgi:hypothetical protein
LNRLLSLAAFATLTLLSTTAARADDCVVNFTDPFGLSIIDPSQAYGFMAPTGGILWYYNQCGYGDDWLYLDENPPGGWPAGTSYNHFHIPFLDPSINCYTTSTAYPLGVMGRQPSPNSPCVAVDPLNAGPRSLLPHQPDEILRIRYLTDPSAPLRYILPTTIRNIGDIPITVLFEDASGGWWQWADLPPGYWSLTGSTPAQQVFVLTSSRTGEEYNVTDIGITLGSFYYPVTFHRSLPLVSSTRHLLSLATKGQNRIGPAIPKTNSGALKADFNGQTTTPVRISAEHAKALLNRSSKDVLVQDPPNLNVLLSAVVHADGIERQLRISDYLQAVDTLSLEEQEAARKQLVAVFEPPK